MSNIPTLDTIGTVAGQRVLVRVDLNVPMKDGKVTDTSRIDAVRPTIVELSRSGAKVVLLAHFGRPKGKAVAQMSLSQVVPTLSERLKQDVAFATMDEAAAAIDALDDGGVLVLENTRFDPGEETNDAGFVERLAKLGDLYVNDAFSAAHRAHASTEGIAHKLKAFAGRAMEAELDALQMALGKPERPVMAIVGGAKVSTKIDLLQHLVTKVDALVVGGGMANTFLHAGDVRVGASLCEPNEKATVRRIMDAADRAGCAVMLPKDAMVAAKLEPGVPVTHVGLEEGVADDMMILDVGPNTVEEICGEMNHAQTLVWNGPLGAFEVPPFDKGTVATARHAAERTKVAGLRTVAGGGDTMAALARAGVVDKFTYVSNAGGAFLEWMEGKALPGVEALKASR